MSMMTWLNLIASTFAFFVISDASFAIPCDPRDFHTTSYESRSDYEKLVLLSTLTDEQAKNIQAGHKGEMTIPYIDIPIKGNFDFAKQISTQLKRLMSIDSTIQSETTVLRSYLDSEGVDAYKACLLTQFVWISVSPSDLYAKEITIVVHWVGGDKAEQGVVDDVSISNGGSFLGDWKRTINSNRAVFLNLRRGDIHQTATVRVLVNGKEAEVILPAKPSRKLEFSAVRFPSEKVKAESYHDNAYNDDRKSGSYLAPVEAEIVLGTGGIAENIELNQTEKCVTEITSVKTANLLCHSVSPTKAVGTSAEAFGTLILVRSVPASD